MGMGMGSVTIADGLRWTSATAYLSPPPASLTIMTDTPVARVVFSGKRAVGIQTVAGQLIKAKKEVILSAGAINTPQLLILSGIGPEEEVKRHGIELVRNAKVGRNLQDHAFVPVGIILKKVSATPFDPASQSPSPMGWFKLPSLEYSSEFRSLPADVQAHMRKSNIPAIEFASHTPPVLLSDGPPTLADDEQFFGALAILMNPQSRGTVQLRSSNLSDAPLMDPKFLSHPFDRLAIIQGVRETMRILSAPTYQDRTVRLIGPSINATDEQIWEYIKGNTHSSWHMAGTARMAQNRDEGVVDAKFRVFGVEGLRVVDLSVLPELINAHTQSAAYVLGEIAAEGLAEEYGLGKH
jgi:choline dehydrogenase-like flavoprotein